MNSAMLNPFGGFFVKNILKELEQQEKSNVKVSSLCIDIKTDCWNLDNGLSVKIVDAPYNINKTEKRNEGAMNEKK